MQIVACLEPLVKAIVLLSKHDSNLLVADAVIKFVFASLSRANTSLSNELLNSIKTEVIPRRNQDLVSLPKVLRHCSFDALKDQRVLKYSSKSRVIEIANRLYARLFPIVQFELQTNSQQDELEVAMESDGFGVEIAASDAVDDGELQLTSFVEEETVPKTNIAKNSNGEVDLKGEFQLSVTNGKLTSNLQQLHDALEVIDPTSTASEQAFSVASMFVTKIRNKTNDELLNVLVFFKYFFKKRTQKKLILTKSDVTF